MKTIVKGAIFSLILTVGLISCSDDDSGGSDIPQGLELAGTWELTAINVSAAIDADFDGTTSANLLNEVSCLEGTLVLDENFEWNSTEVVATLISPITGNLYNVSCSDSQTQNGDWGVSDSNLFLIGSVNRTFLINGDQLIENFGQDLPGIRTMIYSRQQ